MKRNNSNIYEIWNYWDSILNNDFINSVCEESEQPLLTDCQKLDYAMSVNGDYFDDLYLNYDIKTAGKIVVFEKIGAWDKDYYSISILDKFNIAECFRFYDGCLYYCDKYNFRCTLSHHDGTNQYLFRELKPELSYEQIENMIEKAQAGTLTAKAISHYTRSLRPQIMSI